MVWMVRCNRVEPVRSLRVGRAPSLTWLPEVGPAVACSDWSRFGPSRSGRLELQRLALPPVGCLLILCLYALLACFAFVAVILLLFLLAFFLVISLVAWFEELFEDVGTESEAFEFGDDSTDELLELCVRKVFSLCW